MESMGDNELRREIGERLKEGRKQAGYTQSAIAAIMNMTQQQYSRFENGVFELNYAQIVKLCHLYDISSDYLFGLKTY